MVSPGFNGAISGPAAFRPGTKLYDLVVAFPLVAFYGLGVLTKARAIFWTLSAWNTGHFSPMKVLIVVSDISLLSVSSLFVICVLSRPPAVARTQGLFPRVAALAGSYLSIAMLLFLKPTVSSTWVMALSLLLICAGSAFAAYSVFYLGRSVSVMAEARRLVTGGPYRFVRHPLYLGEEVAVIGVCLQYISVSAAFLLLVQICFQFYRMSREEEILSKTFTEYAEHIRRTWRILPGLY